MFCTPNKYVLTPNKYAIGSQITESSEEFSQNTRTLKRTQNTKPPMWKTTCLGASRFKSRDLKIHVNNCYKADRFWNQGRPERLIFADME